MNTEPTQHINPCPFCNGEGVPFRGSIIGKVMVCIRCRDCGAMGPQFFEESKDAKSNANILWNNRAKDNLGEPDYNTTG